MASKKEELQNQIKQLQRERNDAQYQLSQCGIFQGGKKKELGKKIEQINRKIADIQNLIEGVGFYAANKQSYYFDKTSNYKEYCCLIVFILVLKRNKKRTKWFLYNPIGGADAFRTDTM